MSQQDGVKVSEAFGDRNAVAFFGPWSALEESVIDKYAGALSFDEVGRASDFATRRTMRCDSYRSAHVSKTWCGFAALRLAQACALSRSGSLDGKRGVA